MKRLDIEKQNKLEPQRIEYAKLELSKKGIEILFEDNVSLKFMINKKLITLFPYSGWFSGKGIKDGRGIENLLKQLNIE